jgi:hypothetical protein
MQATDRQVRKTVASKLRAMVLILQFSRVFWSSTPEQNIKKIYMNKKTNILIAIP